ncbi:MAG: hypothetical protein QXP66_00945 [Candidatus Aenigmatarchaeota archaeon]
MFIKSLRQGNIQKIAQGITDNIVRTRLRERSVFRRIIPPKYVDVSMLQRFTDSDLLAAVVDIEPLQSNQAIIATFGGLTGSVQVNGKRVFVPLIKVASVEFEKPEEELLAYSYSVTKLIEDNTIKDIEEKEDVQGMKLSLAAINAVGPAAQLTYSAPLTKQVLQSLVSVIDKNMHTGDVATLLMHKSTFDELFGASTANDLGLNLAQDVFISGYKHPTLLGYNYLVTKKSTIIKHGHVFAFSTEQYLGRFYLLSDAKFEIRTQRGIIYWSIWENIGMAIVNPNSVAVAYPSSDTLPSPSDLPLAETGIEVTG